MLTLITYGSKSIRSPLGDTASLKDSLLLTLPKISKKLSPQEKCHFKILQLPIIRVVILLLWRLQYPS